MIDLYAHKGRVRLRLRAFAMGSDIAVLLYGGDAPHIGATALAGPDMATCALQRPHHREGDLAERLAAMLTQRLGRAVGVLCGVHVDAITKQEIADVYTLAQGLAEELARAVEEESWPR